MVKFFRKVGSGDSKDTVNPFLTHMYCSMSFLAWYRISLEKDKSRHIKGLKLKDTLKESKSSMIKEY